MQIFGLITLILSKNFLLILSPVIKTASYFFKLLNFSLNRPDGNLNSFPAKDKELKQTIYVCGIGMIVLGFIGFVVLVIMDNFLPWIFNSLMN